MVTIITASVAFCVGILAGVRLTWWHMNRVWKRYPYQFKTIIDGVIALREASANKESEGV